MIIYHGTAERHLAAILKDGLKPRGGKSKGNWKHTIPSNPKAVYLTTTYALHFAGNACQKGERMAVLKLDTDLLNPFKLAPDEDFLEQATRDMDGTIADQFGNEVPKWGEGIKNIMLIRTKWFRQRALRDFSHLWDKSTEYMGTCCYYGSISPAVISRWALVPRHGALDWASDPTITPLNFKIMGAYYRELMKHVFGEEITVAEDDIMGDRIAQMKAIPRDGVLVSE